VNNLFGRYLKFNFVGGIGIAVQLAALWVYEHVFGMHYLWATGFAVETAVLHNFVWHEHFTWKDRAGGGRWGRLVRFHAGNGVISIAGNVILMRILAGSLGMPHLAANALAIAICSVANFAAGEWFVFRKTGS
jgi:putative flippase GtrA